MTSDTTTVPHARTRGSQAAATTRERLRRAALDLFASRGFRGTTIGDIERASGLAPRAGSFYRHYVSKEAILTDCVDTFVEQILEELSLNDFPPLGQLRAELLLIGQTTLRLARDHRQIRTLLRNEGVRNDALADRMAWINRRFRRRCSLWLRRTLGEDRLDEAGARALALLVFGPLLYYMLELDIGQRAFEVAERDMLEGWASFWAEDLQGRIDA